MFCSRYIMVSHSSSASLSSFHFSHTSFSSLSSPPSSPDSAPSSSRDSFAGLPASSRLALVPFLWEEKPGVSKKAMQMSEGDHVRRNSGAEDGPYGGHTRTRTADSQFCTPTPMSKIQSYGVPHLRLPPRLSQPGVHVDDESDIQLHHHRIHHNCGSSADQVRSKVTFSFSFPKIRHHRRTPSLQDDPFWMAMVACTNDAGKGSPVRCKGGTSGSEMQRRSNSGLVKRVQGHAVHFEQCMPRQTLTGCTIPSRGKSQECTSRLSISETEAASLESTSPSTRDTTHAYKQHDCTNTPQPPIKAFKAPKSEFHGQCTQQQSFPVDISCTARLSKKPNFTSKHKLPDLFGCKSEHRLITP